MTVHELKAKLDANEPVQIIDIREEYELQLATIGGLHLPLGSVLSNLDKINKDIPVVLHCRTGERGRKMVAYLSNMGYNNLHNLEGGINAWAENIDHSIKTY